MAKLNLEKMSTAELRALATELDQEMQKRKKTEVKETAARIKALAAEIGLPVDEILHYGKKTKLPKGEPRYRNPGNPKQTWTGKGRQPAWIKSLLAQGKTLDELEMG
jgi:DNA-binding protein H-NS